MTLKEAASRFKFNPDYLRVAISRKRLSAKKVGRDWIVTEAQMIAFVESSKKP